MGLSCCCCVGVRSLVSKNKRRTVLNAAESPCGAAVNLDLVAVHPRVVAMGFPATGFEATFRNSGDDVKQYLDAKYGAKYWVYNLCCEAQHQYDAAFFYHRVSSYPFRDHTPCSLAMLLAFVTEAEQYLAQDPANVVVLHCKAGKGRTGLFACCLLLRLMPTDSSVASASESLADRMIRYYGEQRTTNGKGLTIPSQIRTVRNFAEAQRRHLLLPSQLHAVTPVVRLTGIRLSHLHNLLSFSAVILEQWPPLPENGNAADERTVDAGGNERTASITVAPPRAAVREPASVSTPRGAMSQPMWRQPSVTVLWDATWEPSTLSSSAVDGSIMTIQWKKPIALRGDFRVELRRKPTDRCASCVAAVSAHSLFLTLQYSVPELDQADRALKGMDYPADTCLELLLS